jgi:hypothetical protein
VTFLYAIVWIIGRPNAADILRTSLPRILMGTNFRRKLSRAVGLMAFVPSSGAVGGSWTRHTWPFGAVVKKHFARGNAECFAVERRPVLVAKLRGKGGRVVLGEGGYAESD